MLNESRLLRRALRTLVGTGRVGALAFTAVSLSAAASAQSGWHCGCTAHPGAVPFGFQPPSDCAYADNTPSTAYDPTFIYEIPVVFHIVENTSGAGSLTDQDVIDQIARLNEDFSGATLGSGQDTGIRFRLATEDPTGSATTGITRSANNTWHQDQGNYAATLAWDTSRYMNIYSLSPMFGALGYVPDIAQGGLAGSSADRVVMNYTAINNPMFEMVLAHEVGHYLGLYHTFGAGQGGNCNNTSCSTQGDLICDTNPHTSPSQQCGGGNGPCGVPEPDHNYMNYLDVSCMYEFTTEQIQRMRCSLEHWRPDLAVPASLGTRYCQAVANSTGAGAPISAGGSLSVALNALALSVESLPQNSFGFFINGQARSAVAGPGGSQGVLCIGGPIGRYVGAGQIQQAGASGMVSLNLDLSAIPRPNGPVSGAIGETWNFQYWYRDTVGGMAASNFSDGIEVVLQ